MANLTPISRQGKKPLFPVSLESCRISSPCWQCKALTPDDGKVDPLLCAACRRMAADSALAELFGTAKALRNGTAPFHVLTPAERNEQLFQLLANDLDLLPASLLVEVAATSAEEICRRVGSVFPTAPAAPVVREMTITELMAEEPYYVGGEAPPADVRDDLESKIELDFDAGDVPAEPVVIRFPVSTDPDFRPAA